MTVFQMYEERLNNTEGCVSDQDDDPQLVRDLFVDYLDTRKHPFNKVFVSSCIRKKSRVLYLFCVRV
jgi:hypothetical protein